MGYLRTATGSATLIVDGVACGEVSYNLEISSGRNGATTADGEITADAGLSSAWEGGSTVLRMASGQEMEIVLVEWNPMSNAASVKSSGHVPPL